MKTSPIKVLKRVKDIRYVEYHGKYYMAYRKKMRHDNRTRVPHKSKRPSVQFHLILEVTKDYIDSL